MKLTFPLLLAGALLLLANSVSSAEVPAPMLVLNDTNEPPYTTPDGQGFLDVIVNEAFRRAGVQLRLVKLPAERGLINANSGEEDGDMARIAGLEALYPNLIRVPENLIVWEFTAFSRNAALPARWDVLRTHPIGHIRGWKIYEERLIGAPLDISSDDATQMFRQLNLGRIEVALYERWLGLSLLKHQDIQGVYPLEPPLAKREMFIYLNKRHAALVPRIAEALRAIKAEGLYNRLYREKVMAAKATGPK
jgi:polar amino acid transport system substrate-binding protein